MLTKSSHNNNKSLFQVVLFGYVKMKLFKLNCLSSRNISQRDRTAHVRIDRRPRRQMKEIVKWMKRTKLFDLQAAGNRRKDPTWPGFWRCTDKWEH